MADLATTPKIPETGVWDDEIVELGAWSVDAGPLDVPNDTGLDNWPHQQLANRTRWLKAAVDEIRLSGLGEVVTLTRDTVPAGVRLLPLQGGEISRNGEFAALWAHAQASNMLAQSEAIKDADILNSTLFGPGNGVDTMTLPEARGVVIRGADLSRGLDPARVFGSMQLDAIQNITGSFAHRRITGGVNPTLYAETGVFTETNNGGSATNILEALATQRTGYDVNFDLDAAGVRNADETRMINAAYLLCIRY